MIKMERTSVMNFENAIRGARNPLNSWNRMDSRYERTADQLSNPGGERPQSGQTPGARRQRSPQVHPSDLRVGRFRCAAVLVERI